MSWIRGNNPADIHRRNGYYRILNEAVEVLDGSRTRIRNVPGHIANPRILNL